LLCQLLAGQGGQEGAHHPDPCGADLGYLLGTTASSGDRPRGPSAPATSRMAPPAGPTCPNGRESHLSTERTRLVRSAGSLALPRTSVALLHESDASGNLRVGAEGAAGRRASSPATPPVEQHNRALSSPRPDSLLRLDESITTAGVPPGSPWCPAASQRLPICASGRSSADQPPHLSSRRCGPSRTNNPPGNQLRHEGATRS
jgi:hypothetical protein